jgi:NAD-dependent SIR2 family protein deacetylase
MGGNMLFYKCKKCKKVVWFWQSCAEVILVLKSGKKKIIRYCFDCGSKLAKEVANQTRVEQ